MIPFSAKRQSCGQEAGAFCGKSIGPGISDFGLRISDFLVFFFNPPVVGSYRHSAIYIPQFWEAGPWAIHRIAPTRVQPEEVVLALCPPGPRNGMGLMIFPQNAPASWPGNAWNSRRGYAHH